MGNKQSANRSGTLKKGDLDATDDPANFGREIESPLHGKPLHAVRIDDRFRRPNHPYRPLRHWFSSVPTSNWETLSDDAKSREAQGNLVFRGSDGGRRVAGRSEARPMLSTNHWKHPSDRFGRIHRHNSNSRLHCSPRPSKRINHTYCLSSIVAHTPSLHHLLLEHHCHAHRRRLYCSSVASTLLLFSLKESQEEYCEGPKIWVPPYTGAHVAVLPFFIPPRPPLV
ncbi:hypothetical protein BHM03_00019479 [Ensete ventricosum]|nr:hypothetical protein BHM03_00019479 [Ensete ventricosum]